MPCRVVDIFLFKMTDILRCLLDGMAPHTILILIIGWHIGVRVYDYILGWVFSWNVNKENCWGGSTALIPTLQKGNQMLYEGVTIFVILQAVLHWNVSYLAIPWLNICTNMITMQWNNYDSLLYVVVGDVYEFSIVNFLLFLPECSRYLQQFLEMSWCITSVLLHSVCGAWYTNASSHTAMDLFLDLFHDAYSFHFRISWLPLLHLSVVTVHPVLSNYF